MGHRNLDASVTGARLIVTALGIGLLRPAPGTWASGAACLASLPILMAGGPWLLAGLVVAAAVLALWAIPHANTLTGVEDPPEVVIDEVAGQWIALLPVAFGAWSSGVSFTALWPGWVAAFLLFRLFDVWKPGPVGWADRRPGAWGVLLDDLIAGCLAALGVMVLAGVAHGWLMR